MFQTVPLSIIMSFFFFHCTHSNGICHTGLLTACEQAVSKHSISGYNFNMSQTPFKNHLSDQTHTQNISLLG